MPAPKQESALCAVDEVSSSLRGKYDANSQFMKNFVDDPMIRAIVKQYDALTELRTPAETSDSLRETHELSEQLGQMNSTEAAQLKKLVNLPHLQALLVAHDEAADGKFEEEQEVFQSDAPVNNMFSASEAQKPALPPNMFNPRDHNIRMVSVRRTPGETLGLTVKTEHGQLVVARILAGSTIDTQGLLKVGDTILEVNGHEVTTPQNLQDIMKKIDGNVVFKIIPALVNETQSATMFVRCHFNYSPARDNLLPCREAGLEFLDGDILEITNKSDPNWWQARRIDDVLVSGLIPSQALEERRKAWVKPEWDMAKTSWLCGLGVKRRKKKVMYVIRRNNDLDKGDIPIYEEVARLPPFHRKTLVLVGASGVGKRTLKLRLLDYYPDKYVTVVPHTSRPLTEVDDPAAYHFTTREEMERDILDNNYLEWGEYRGHLYGVRTDSIQAVVESGRVCVLDVNPQALKALRTPDYLPYICFVAAPSADILRNMYEQARLDGITQKQQNEEDFIKTVQESTKLERHYKHMFDSTIINDNMDAAFERLLENLEIVATQPQWVPIEWIY